MISSSAIRRIASLKMPSASLRQLLVILSDECDAQCDAEPSVTICSQDEHIGPKPTGSAERMRRLREKKASQAVTCDADSDVTCDTSLPPSPSPSLPPSPPSPYPSLPAHPHAPTHTHPPTRGEAELPLVLEADEPPPPATPTPFDQFWKAYPKKLAKESARKAWDKLKLNPKLAEIVGAVESQKQTHDWTRESGRFIPHPATWLNAHRWEDDTSGNNPNIIEAIDTDNIPEFNPETDVCPF